MTIIITICALLLLAYAFDLTSSKTKIPSVILLLFLGWVVRQITILLNFRLPDFTLILPILGTIGLILIVLEGSLDLELNKSKLKLVKKSLLGSLLSMLAMAFSLGYLFKYFGDVSLIDGLTNAIPFCVISSAIAIPSVRHLSSSLKEYIVYESSFSDISGVVFFNFVALNDNFNASSYGHFALQLLIILIISFVATYVLTILLGRIEHHIKFIPIILLIILIYAITKEYHLPALIFIMLFGLFLGNLDKLKRFKFINSNRLDNLGKEVIRFKEINVEITFLIRALFFLLFGYLIETPEIINTQTLIWAIGIVMLIFAFRTVQLLISRLPLIPLLFVAPRGLITILLFLSVAETQQIPLVNKSLIIQVIILTALIMMVGIIITKKGAEIET
ncbi:MAG: hypothetical protein KBB11_03195 [Bacteroidales bacterium]|nr:hypothetical protein [Bacteroidales bacterium]HOY38646.1 hypothetical protein [Bacteroidales bacterium]HQP03630.1 hypothetical protein [Bacteroidales bacterium]